MQTELKVSRQNLKEAIKETLGYRKIIVNSKIMVYSRSKVISNSKTESLPEV